VGTVIGRGGERVRQIQTDTNTRIRFDDHYSSGGGDGDDGDGNGLNRSRLVVIKGSVEATARAEMIINEIIRQQSSVTTKSFKVETSSVGYIIVETSSVGYIIGRNGLTIQSIRDKSGAQIKVEPKSKQTNPVMTSLDITGTDEQIEEAFELMNKEIALRNSQQNRCQQNYSQMAIPVTKPLTIDIEASDSPLDLDHYFSRLNRIGGNEVFVSAVKSPDEFYVQIGGAGAQHLDLLVEEITAFYSNEDNRICIKPTSVRMGDIVAVPFPYDDHWYRARVVAIETSLESEVESMVDVFYVDYGNQLVLEYNQICTLNDQFLRRLPFQAMCCSLYGVQPNDHLNWSQQSIQKFKELSHLEKWKPLFAKVIEMKIIDGKHEMYCIDLIDKNRDISSNEESSDDRNDNPNVMHLNIALELIAKDFAIACDDSEDIAIR
ncbi:unnamed protein product, partial [Oppiella nova]